MTEYCLWKANCVLLNPKKFAKDNLNTYMCCHSCKDKTCEYRCKDSLESCTSLSDKNYTQELVDRANRPIFFSQPRAVEKIVKDKLPKSECNVVHNQSAKVEQPKKQDFIIPQNKKELAKILGVSYDKVAYRIEVKHKTYEEVYKELKNDN